MSRLFLSDRGRVFVLANEELTRWRWVKKVLTLPGAGAIAKPQAADLWVLALSYGGNRGALRVEVNGKSGAIAKPQAADADRWRWVKVAIPAGLLRRGRNEFVFKCDNPAMSGWMLGIDADPGLREPQSYLSTDRGKTWRNDALGAHGVLRGEYAVRLRVHDERLKESALPSITYENPRHPRVRELLGLLPKRIVAARDPWRQLLALRSWTATRWVYEKRGTVYTPWDPWTLLAWPGRPMLHGRHRQRVAFCVHYGMFFASMAAALGHKARGLAVTGGLNGLAGHFLAEVWDSQRKQWVMHDANLDAHFEMDDHPLSAVDVLDHCRAGGKLKALTRWGDGRPINSPYLRRFYRNAVANGAAFGLMGVWKDNDVVSNPLSAPPNHGATVYTETDFVWYDARKPAMAEMFPYRTADRAWFDAAP